MLPFLKALGLPEFSNASLPACYGLVTPADLHILAKSDAFVLPLAHGKTLGVRYCHFEAVPALQGARSPPKAYKILCLRLNHLVHRPILQSSSAMGPRLDTGGWLTLPEAHY